MKLSILNLSIPFNFSLSLAILALTLYVIAKWIDYRVTLLTKLSRPSGATINRAYPPGDDPTYPLGLEEYTSELMKTFGFAHTTHPKAEKDSEEDDEGVDSSSYTHKGSQPNLEENILVNAQPDNVPNTTLHEDFCYSDTCFGVPVRTAHVYTGSPLICVPDAAQHGDRAYYVQESFASPRIVSVWLSLKALLLAMDRAGAPALGPADAPADRAWSSLRRWMLLWPRTRVCVHSLASFTVRPSHSPESVLFAPFRAAPAPAGPARVEDSRHDSDSADESSVDEPAAAASPALGSPLPLPGGVAAAVLHVDGAESAALELCEDSEAVLLGHARWSLDADHARTAVSKARVRALGYTLSLTARRPRAPLHRLSVKAEGMGAPGDSNWTWAASPGGSIDCIPRLSRCVPLWRGERTGLGTRSAIVCVPRVIYHDDANDRFAAAEWVLLHVVCSSATTPPRTQ